MSGRQRLGGISTPPSAYSANSTRADPSFPLPAGSIAAGAPLKFGKASQAVIDCLAVLAAFLLFSATGIGIAFALFTLFFARL